MSDKKQDRRTLRTQSMLQEALISLFLVKDYEAITIQDITDTANVGRSTFYAHYTCKDDLLRGSFDRLRVLLVGQQLEAKEKPVGGKPKKLLGFSRAMLEHTQSHLDLYRALTGGHGGTIALNCLRQILSELVRDELKEITDEKSGQMVPQELAVQYIVGAFMAVMTWWLDRHANIPVEQVDAMFRRMALQGIGQGIELTA